MTRPQDVLEFWLAPATRERWFDKDEAFDAEIRQRFQQTYEDAAAGKLDDWMRDRDGALALVIVLDQLPRNMFRDSPKAFATDAKAREVTEHALARGFDLELADEDHRMLFYLPLEHSEDMSDQENCVSLVLERAPGSEFPDYAKAHREVIARFGRFPHRNAILGRPNSPDEEDYLKDPNAGF